jgi:hypothetical protein
VKWLFCHSRRLRVAILAAALAAAGVLLIKDAHESARSQRVETPAVDQSVSCKTLLRSVNGCAIIDLGDQRYRYALIRRPGAAKTVVVDPGGPGVAVLGAGYPREIVDFFQDENVLLVDEPWATAASMPSCDAALSSWYEALRATWPRPDRELVDTKIEKIITDCGLFGNDPAWGFSPQQYRALLTAITDKNQLHLDTFVGFSFGSARWDYSADLFDRGWLVSPFPVGMPAQQYVNIEASVRAPGLDRKILGGTVRGRSLPISELDLAAAQAESLYLPPPARFSLFGGGDEGYLVGRLADQFMGRYGVNSISRNVLAFWQETCPALNGWGTLQVSPSHDLRGEMLRVCAVAGTRLMPNAISDVKQPSCVVAVRGDGVTPWETATWLNQMRHWATNFVISGGHANGAGVERCARDASAGSSIR